MMSYVEVTCPHCGAHGQIMLPPAGAIVVGPCPECRGLVVVFCGQVLALDKELMLKGSFEGRRGHLMDVLTTFLLSKVTELLTEGADAQAEKHAAESPRKIARRPAKAHHMSGKGTHEEVPISQEEFDVFVRDEINLLDNGEWFKAIFG